MQIEKVKKTCSDCETKYTIEWDMEEQDLNPLTCPFCGHEVLEEEEYETRYEEDDSWD
jgi:DNA-directed RNA polymerase subunit RPC12/RpoP